MSSENSHAQISVQLTTMMDMVRWCTTQFNQAELYFGHGTDNAWDEAVSLVLHVLHLPYNIFTQSGEGVMQAKLTDAEKLQIVELAQRRCEERIPLAYLTQEAWFNGLPFYVDERVLVPRSPFAELIENGFADFINEPPKHILDMCTGSGCIAIGLAYQFEEAQVDAVDISGDALSVAEFNIEQHGMLNRVLPLQSDLFEALQGHQYDLLITNPPYVDAEDMADLPHEFEHEPELGLAAGQDGLELVDTILRDAPKHMTDGAWLFVEVGNSLVHVNARYPELKLTWVTLENGGDGIFAVQKEDLVAFNAA